MSSRMSRPDAIAASSGARGVPYDDSNTRAHSASSPDDCLPFEFFFAHEAVVDSLRLVLSRGARVVNDIENSKPAIAFSAAR